MKIHPCNKQIILFSASIIILVSFIMYMLIPFWLFVFLLIVGLVKMLLIVRFFRYPTRILEHIQNNTVYSSADGVVVAVEEVLDTTFSKEKYIQVSVFMSPLNVHLNWIPINGIITGIKYLKGKYLVASNPKSSMENEMLCTMIETENGQGVIIKQIAGFVARRIIGFQHQDNNVKAGDELGFIKFGSRVDLLLPLGSSVQVRIGEKVKGLKTIIAMLPDNQ